MLREFPSFRVGLGLTMMVGCGLVTQSCASMQTGANAEMLVDQLLDVATPVDGANAGFGSGGRAIVMALQDNPATHGSSLPDTPAAMRQLAQMGVAALPTLLKHLDDPRPTKLSIHRNPGNFDAFFGDEYDARATIPSASTSASAELARYAQHPVPNGEYIIRVGDLCFVLVGQIVNRNLVAARAEGVSRIINSPVETPALAAATRKDWGRLTPTDHAVSLLQDIDRHRGNPALTYARLCYYYPLTGEKPVLEVLNRMPLSTKQIRAFLLEDVLSVNEPAEWDGLATVAKRRFSPLSLNPFITRLKIWTSYDPKALPEDAAGRVALGPWELQDQFFTRHIASTQPGSYTIQEILRQPEWDRAKQIIQLWSARQSEHGNLTDGPNTEEVNYLANVLAQLNSYANPYVDEAAYTLFTRSRSLYHLKGMDENSMDHVALACADRLAGRGHDPEFRAYFEQRLPMLNDGSMISRSRIGQINEVLKKLAPTEPPHP